MIYSISYILAYYFIKIFFSGESSGLENYPKKGPFIVAFNHNSGFDVLSIALGVRFRAHSMGKIELFKIPILGWWLSKVNVHPIIRDSSDKEGYERIVSILKNGNIVIMAPEGTRKWKKGIAPRPKTGMIRLAQTVNCPIVPMAIYGTRNILPPGSLLPRWNKIVVRVGKPIYPQPVEVSPENYDLLQQQAKEVMDRLYELLPSSLSPEKKENQRNRLHESSQLERIQYA